MLEKIKKLMAEGKSNQEIIDELGLTEEDLESLQKESKDVDKNSSAKSKKNEQDDDDDDDDDSDDDDDDDDDKSNKNEEVELVQISTSDLEIDGEVSNLLGDETLSEETREKTRVLFETAVVNTVNVQLEKLQTQYNKLLEEKLEERTNDIVDNVDIYLDHIVDKWAEDNKVAIESSIRTEISESFIADLKEVFENHQIEIPEDKVDTVAELAEQNEEMEARLDAEINENINLKKELVEMKKDKIKTQVAENLTDTEVEKLNEMISHIDYDNDENYLKSLAVIKESMFKKHTDIKLVESVEENLDTAGTNKDLNEDDDETKLVTKKSKYAEAISRSVLK